ncbi:MAG: MoaD/ThiS family protein [Pyrinomonadaceae bacterium]|nr:MoaD/ThiS family protein [Pyrinomonadaceae bacterium]
MEIKLLFFGATADAAGTRLDRLVVEEGSSIRGTMVKIADKYPPLKNHKLNFAVNEEYVDQSEILKDGDELAIFTAVSGG